MTFNTGNQIRLYYFFLPNPILRTNHILTSKPVYLHKPTDWAIHIPAPVSIVLVSRSVRKSQPHCTNTSLKFTTQQGISLFVRLYQDVFTLHCVVIGCDTIHYTGVHNVIVTQLLLLPDIAQSHTAGPNLKGSICCRIVAAFLPLSSL